MRDTEHYDIYRGGSVLRRELLDAFGNAVARQERDGLGGFRDLATARIEYWS